MRAKKWPEPPKRLKVALMVFETHSDHWNWVIFIGPRCHLSHSGVYASKSLATRAGKRAAKTVNWEIVPVKLK